MKKLFFAVFLAVCLAACGSYKAYNTQLKQVELGMTRSEIVTLMGDKYTTTGVKNISGKEFEIIEYKDMYKNHFYFEFSDNKLYKWYRENEEGK